MNILKIDLDGDNSATNLILTKLFENSNNDSLEEVDFEYVNVAKDLEGLNVRVSKHTATEDPPNALIIVLDSTSEDPINIEKYINKHPETTTVSISITGHHALHKRPYKP